MNEDAIIMWPVDDTGKNSVMPSITARISAAKYVMVLSLS
jgi:hypothetical protein